MRETWGTRKTPAKHAPERREVLPLASQFLSDAFEWVELFYELVLMPFLGSVDDVL
jgi:hypothetical protein